MHTVKSQFKGKTRTAIMAVHKMDAIHDNYIA